MAETSSTVQSAVRASHEHDSRAFAWKADSFKGPEAYSVFLDDADRAQIMNVVGRWELQGRSKPLESLSADNIALDSSAAGRALVAERQR